MLASSNDKEKLNLNIPHILNKNITKVMLANYIIGGNVRSDGEQRQQELNNFLTILDVKCKEIFAPAGKSAVVKRKPILQKPDQLPQEEDVGRLRMKIDEKLLPPCAALEYKDIRMLLGHCSSFDLHFVAKSVKIKSLPKYRK